MSKNKDNTIRIDESDKTIKSDQTIRINDENLKSGDQTQRVDYDGVIKSGLGGGISIKASQSNIFEFNE